MSVVRSDVAFAFAAIAGTEWGAPRWVYLPSPEGTPVTDLEEICAALRTHLTPETEDRPLDGAAAQTLEKVLAQLALHEERLLPRGKQRALAEMRRVLRRYERDSMNDPARLRVIEALLALAKGEHEGGAVDRAALADWWLRTIQPVRFRHLAARARTRPVLLRNLRADLLRTPLDTAELERGFEAPVFTSPIDERVVAAIIGVA